MRPWLPRAVALALGLVAATGFAPSAPLHVRRTRIVATFGLEIVAMAVEP